MRSNDADAVDATVGRRFRRQFDFHRGFDGHTELLSATPADA
jgi:hypothetical protein